MAKGSAINKPQPLSPEMAAFVGKRKESRGGVMKALWAYIKRRKLQHKTEKRYIQLDEKLCELFENELGDLKPKDFLGPKKNCVVSMFALAKLVSPHIHQEGGAAPKVSKATKKKTSRKSNPVEEYEEDEDDDEYGDEDYGFNDEDEDDDDTPYYDAEDDDDDYED